MTKHVSKHFTESELACPCCGVNKVDQALLEILEQIRVFYNKGMPVNSGYRCSKHNAEVGGVPNSEHMLGLAVDIVCNSSADRFNLIQLALCYNVVRIGISEGFVHLGISQVHPQERIWLY